MGSNQPSQANKNPKLFVFGNSYADTGNMKPTALSWKLPYGITFPGKPSGRYSDGLTATDFLGSTLTLILKTSIVLNVSLHDKYNQTYQ